MGDAILFGVLRMPPELWRDDDFDKRQRHARYVQAANEIEALRAEVERLRAELARVRELPAKWRAAPQNPDEPLLAIAADELDAALADGEAAP